MEIFVHIPFCMVCCIILAHKYVIQAFGSLKICFLCDPQVPFMCYSKTIIVQVGFNTPYIVLPKHANSLMLLFCTAQQFFNQKITCVLCICIIELSTKAEHTGNLYSTLEWLNSSFRPERRKISQIFFYHPIGFINEHDANKFWL